MKKYLLSLFLFTLVVKASAQSSQTICTGTSCTKSSTECQAICAQTCTQNCTKSQVFAGTLWSGQIEINGKNYLATGKVYSTDKGILAKISIADLKITNEIFAISKSKSNSYSFTPKNNLGFIATTKDYTVSEVQ